MFVLSYHKSVLLLKIGVKRVVFFFPRLMRVWKLRRLKGNNRETSSYSIIQMPTSPSQRHIEIQTIAIFSDSTSQPHSYSVFSVFSFAFCLFRIFFFYLALFLPDCRCETPNGFLSLSFWKKLSPGQLSFFFFLVHLLYYFFGGYFYPFIFPYMFWFLLLLLF